MNTPTSKETPMPIPHHTLAAGEYSDADGGALTITPMYGHLYVTCTHGADEVTVGPLPPSTLTAAQETDGFERDPDTGQIFLLLPVPVGAYPIGARATITFEEPR